jgi:predicted sugar kinase
MGDRNVRNLHMATIEIENSRGRDFGKVGLKVYTTNDTVLFE